MHRVSELIGKAIVSTETGNRLGRVSDTLLEEGGVNVVGIVVGGGLVASERVLPFPDVQTLGGDAVLARTDAGMRSSKEWHRSGIKATRSSALRGRPVVTAAGQRLGEVSDLLLNDETGAFEGLEVAEHTHAGLRRKRAILRASRDLRIGPDVIVVPDGNLLPDAKPLEDAGHRGHQRVDEAGPQAGDAREQS